MRKKIWAALVCVTLVLSLIPCTAEAAEIATAGGWNETIYAQLTGVTDEQITGVSYSGDTTGSLTGSDLEYLVRAADGGVRIDIPGVPAGTYTLTVTTSAGVLTKSGIVVPAQDRSGYAHFGTDEGVGAYNNDGTLKKNAIVLYVTEENKNTVTVTAKDGTTVSGIGNILNSVGQEGNSKGKANTNQDILRKLSADGTPLVVRIVGTVTAPEGLTAYNSQDYGGSVGDNGYMARMSGGKDITVEGIGTGAVMDGWGLHFICQTSDYSRGWGRSFEVRNLSFRNVPEDCVGMEGQQENSTLTAPVERCWIHNCAFYAPKITNPAESDKDGGDGACDFKRGQYFTNSYCYYQGYHKTNLVGGSDSNLQYHMTYHHNYWKNCESRAPLARQANIHMYNNLFEGQSSYCMSLRANSYIFSEYNIYVNCKKVSDGKTGGVCKSYNNSFTGCTGTDVSALVQVSDRNTTVSSNNKYANFDTNSNLSYIPQGNYLLHEDLTEMKAYVLSHAGPQGVSLSSDSTEPEQPVDPSNPGGDTVIHPAGSYIHNFTADGMTSEFYEISGNLSTSKGTVSYAGLTLTRCLKIETATTIGFTAPESGTLTLVFGGSTSAAGKTVKIDGVKQTIGNDHTLTVTVSAGAHTVTKGDSINLFYMVYTSDSVTGGQEPHIHSYTATVTQPATCEKTGEKTYCCSCGDSYVEQIPAAGHDYEAEGITASCTEPGVVVYTCNRCGDCYEQTGVSLGHSYDSETVESTCCEAGQILYTCIRCGDSYTQALELAEHSYEYRTTPASCTADGETVYCCTLCGDTGVQILTATGHSYQSRQIPATCTQQGYTTHTCTACGDQYIDAEEPATGNHSFGQWEQRADGAWEHTCTVCGYSQTQADTSGPAEPTEQQDQTQENAGGIWIAMYGMIALAAVCVAGLIVVLIRNRKKA